MKKLKIAFAAVSLAGLFLFVNGCKKEATKPAPVSCIQLASDSVQTGAAVNFSSCSTNGTTYLWSFGDGSSSTNESATHTYTAVGTYTVTLTVSSAQGTSTATKTVVVIAPITSANYIGTYSCSDACSSGSYTYQMTVIANGNNAIRMTNFGDWGSVTIDATIDGNNITIPSQTFNPGGGNVTISGTGTANAGILVLTIQSVATNGTNTDTCTTTATKQ